MADLTDITPTTTDIAALLWARTKGPLGEVGDFTSDTRPTGAQVQTLIDRTVAKVGESIGKTIPDGIAELGKSAVETKVAMMIELSFFPEQINSDRSPYNALRDLDKDTWPAFTLAVAAAGDGDDPGAIDDVALPAFGFPDDNFAGSEPW